MSSADEFPVDPDVRALMGKLSDDMDEALDGPDADEVAEMVEAVRQHMSKVLGVPIDEIYVDGVDVIPDGVSVKMHHHRSALKVEQRVTTPPTPPADPPKEDEPPNLVELLSFFVFGSLAFQGAISAAEGLPVWQRLLLYVGTSASFAIVLWRWQSKL